MKRCFGYIRVSTTKQGDGVSLEAQKDAIVAFAERNDVVIVEWFEELQTAAKGGRPIFNAMLRQLKANKADGVVIHKIDRSARNFADWAKIAELSDRGIDVHFVTETLDFRSRGGRLAADIQAVIAADYIRNLREETIKGIRGRLKQGIYPFWAPLGYVDNGGGKPKTPDPVRAPLIAELFSLYASGQYSIRALEAEMDARGLRNRHGKSVTKVGIETILDNPFYIGIIRLKKSGDVYQGVHQPLISERVYQRVREVRAGRFVKKVTRHNHTYRGLFRCGDCSGPIKPELQRGHVYYRCQARRCPTKTVREEIIEAAVMDLLSRCPLSDEAIAALLRKFDNWCTERDIAAQKENPVEMQLTHLNRRLEKLTDALVDQLIDKDTFNDRKQTLLFERARLEETLARRKNRRSERVRVQDFVEHVKSLAQSYISANSAEKRELVSLIASNRTVTGRNVELEPSKWLQAVADTSGVLSGAPHRTTSRRPPQMSDELAAELIKASQALHSFRRIG